MTPWNRYVNTVFKGKENNDLNPFGLEESLTTIHPAALARLLGLMSDEEIENMDSEDVKVEAIKRLIKNGIPILIEPGYENTERVSLYSCVWVYRGLIVDITRKMQYEGIQPRNV